MLSGLLLMTCSPPTENIHNDDGQDWLVVLGIAQDAGFPQAGCQKSCCKEVWDHPEKRKKVTSLGIVSPELGKHWIIDATPDIKDQLYSLQSQWGTELAGVFLTHAHMGHYTGLIHLGREAMGSHQIPVYAMPRMQTFLETNGPWDQLVSLDNIELKTLQADSSIQLTPQLSITPILVPHRDEYSETVGFEIAGAGQTILFIPDIDKWEKWERDIRELLPLVDLAFIDGSFYGENELPGRDMSLIPHPLVEESMALLDILSPSDRAKINFIHFNHTNPLLQEKSQARKELKQKGFNLAVEGRKYPL